MHLTLTDQPEMITCENTLEKWFSRFRRNIIGLHQFFETPFGEKQILYADWTASGRAYRAIQHPHQHQHYGDFDVHGL